MTYVNVALPVPKRHLFSYKIPNGVNVPIGSRLSVPFHRKIAVGYAVSFSENLPNGVKESSIREIKEILDSTPVFSENLLKLANWISSYYFAPIGEVIRTMLPNYLNRIEIESVNPRELHELKDLPESKVPTLTSEQNNAVKKIDSSEKPYLLYGITGSGKTEIYIRIVEKLLNEGKGAIVLVPEIGLTPQQISRFASRLGKEKIALYHSGLTDTQRLKQWQRIQSGEAKIVIGTRSAIFMPIQNLSAIIVDEEHDGSYKQEEGVKYNARDVAVVRGQNEKAIVILGSATPSVQSMYNADVGKYELVELKDRPTGSLPEVDVVDLRASEKSDHFVSKHLEVELKKCKTNKSQAIIFLNRRGFASQIVCRDCGFVFECPNCDIALTYHKGNDPKLLCHYCGYQISAPSKCEKCESPNIIPIGRGTERIETELAATLEGLKTERLDSDSATPKRRREILNSMDKGACDVLIGTQMVAKGHDFPNLSLVGVALADSSLYLPDFRAGERTFQLLSQVAGRAGRRDNDSKVVVQTYQPEHYAIMAAKDHDYREFYTKELDFRRELNYPPFSRLANIKLLGNDGQKVERNVVSLADKLRAKKLSGISILGPAPCSQRKLRGKYRWQILIKAENAKMLNNFIKLHLNEIDSIESGIRVLIDIDPIALL